MRDVGEVAIPPEELLAMCERVASTPFATEYARLQPLSRLHEKNKKRKAPQAESADAAKRQQIAQPNSQGNQRKTPVLKLKQPQPSG